MVVASWIVLDDAESATAFPSAGRNSASADFQRIYWRCIAVYFLTARIHNPAVRLMLYANVDPDAAAPPEIAAALHALGVGFRRVVPTLRLPRGSVSAFGNQFYVLDVIRDFATHEDGDALVLTDSDCVWRGSVAGIEAALRDHDCLLYTLRPADQKGYEVGRLMNGMSRARMTEIAQAAFAFPADRQVQYHGGEFFAATRGFCRDIQPRVATLWRRAVAEAALPDSIKEEAHFLSIIAEGMGVSPETANVFIRRIWTNFEDLNPVPADSELTVWHLPAEKRFGFRRLWRYLQTSERNWQSFTPAEINRLTARYMGVPRRGAVKLVRDVAEKLRERVARTA
jgi:hypothetical protein